MTVHDAIPKESGLSVSFTALCQNPALAGFLLSESVTRMNDCPRRYTQKTAAYRSVSPLYVKTPLRRGFCYLNP
ncbi:hypothetical protein EC587_04010 [Klebsiella quasipneumoniae subsp. quasipneumoniae]|nr:hypothetical protein [Klebsiella quasipneumoniae]QER52649.1 hypothetical protein F2980_05615 [Klebsiella quasipneumoniae subsp. quasipneumoniae]TBP45948.1 hypothetical protein EXU05_06235 [Klebsiella quasipneumoniae subsp. quasipneumoniae]TBP69835.1 hypothetical protein EXT99_13440 [Klebsiella quasipneumoniae subsp. quasipneumoniae]TBQ06154.1 hypothetical protein EXU07_08170 [Klebsiella quasipneumoniae subsp. quasipneumoniae]